MSLLPVAQATWAPKGVTPVLHHRFSCKRMSMAGVLAYRHDRSRSAFVFSLTDSAYNTDNASSSRTVQSVSPGQRLSGESYARW